MCDRHIGHVHLRTYISSMKSCKKIIKIVRNDGFCFGKSNEEQQKVGIKMKLMLLLTLEKRMIEYIAQK